MFCTENLNYELLQNVVGGNYCGGIDPFVSLDEQYIGKQVLYNGLYWTNQSFNYTEYEKGTYSTEFTVTLKQVNTGSEITISDKTFDNIKDTAC